MIELNADKYAECFEFVQNLLEEKYKEQTSNMLTHKTKAIELNIGDFPAEYVNDLVNNYFDSWIRKSLKTYFDDWGYYVFKGFPPMVNMREICGEDVGKLVTIHGTVTKALSPKFIIRVGVFRCNDPDCGRLHTIEQSNPFITFPVQCNCGGKKFSLIDHMSKWDDYQEMTVQENPEDTKTNDVPRVHIIKMIGHHLLDKCKPGDNVDITCIVGSKQGSNPYAKDYKPDLTANNIEVLNKDSFNTVLTPEDEEEVKRWSQDPNILDILLNSIFPSIYGWREEKYGILMSLFGGVEEKRRDKNFRKEINTLLLGDPSLAKTAMIIGASNVAPKAIYTQAKGTTGVGLTAAAVKEDEQWVLSAGAVVLASGGICAVDEIEKMERVDQDALLESMELGTIHVNKATIRATLNAKTTILAAANPKYGRFDPHYTLAENITLPPPLLSRFDLIYIMRDLPDEESDSKIVDRIFDSLEESSMIDELPTINEETLKKYILYGRMHNPTLGPGIRSILKGFFIDIRKDSYGSDEKPIPITIRQFEGAIRLAQAHARMTFKSVVDEDDARAAVELIMSCLRKANIDPKTGQMDSTGLESGKQKSKTDIEKTILQAIPISSKISKEELFEKLSGGVTREQLDDFLTRNSKDRGTVMNDHSGISRLPQ